MSIKIDPEKCCWKDGKCSSCLCGGACTGCAEVCPTKAITREKTLVIDKSKCINCGMCINSCKHSALSLI